MNWSSSKPECPADRIRLNIAAVRLERERYRIRRELQNRVDEVQRMLMVLPGADAIVDEVCRQHGITFLDLIRPAGRSASAPRKFSKARKAISIRLRERGMSFPAIGKLLCVSHSTIVEACK